MNSIKKIAGPVKTFLITLAVLCLFEPNFLIGEDSKKARGYDIQIFYSGSQSGYLDPCG